MFYRLVFNNQPAPNTPDIEANAINHPPNNGDKDPARPRAILRLEWGELCAGNCYNDSLLLMRRLSFSFTDSSFTVLTIVCLKRILAGPIA